MEEQWVLGGWSEARNDDSGDLRMFCEAGTIRGERTRAVKNSYSIVVM